MMCVCVCSLTPLSPFLAFCLLSSLPPSSLSLYLPSPLCLSLSLTHSLTLSHTLLLTLYILISFVRTYNKINGALQQLEYFMHMDWRVSVSLSLLSPSIVSLTLLLTLSLSLTHTHSHTRSLTHSLPLSYSHSPPSLSSGQMKIRTSCLP